MASFTLCNKAENLQLYLLEDLACTDANYMPGTMVSFGMHTLVLMLTKVNKENYEYYAGLGIKN